MMNMPFFENFYAHTYHYFHHPIYQQIRHETYRDGDIGQNSWLTKEEFLQFLAWMELERGSNILDIGSGSGGPALFVAQQFHSQVIGIERNEHGIAIAKGMVDMLQLQSQVQFRLADVTNHLPFKDRYFDSIICIDSLGITHSRLHIFKEWHRILKDKGYVIFTDQILTGFVSSGEIIDRSIIGPFSMAPIGYNERLLDEAKLKLIRYENVTKSVITTSQKWCDARQKQISQLMALEGKNFKDIQQYLTVVHMLAHEQRLSRYVFLARKAGDHSRTGADCCVY